MKRLYFAIPAYILLSGCSLLKPPPPVAVEVPVETTGRVHNPAYPADREAQIAGYKRDAEACNALAPQTRIPSKECLKTKGWKNIK